MRHKNADLMNQMIRYVEKYRLRYHCSPSTTEIADALGIVKSTAYKYLVEMNNKGMIRYDGKDIETEVTSKDKDDMISAAVLGSVSCGLPQFEEENIEEYVSLPASLFGYGEFFILRAKGDSMVDAGINSGDLVVIRRQSEAEEGQIVVALVENQNTLKRYYLDRSKNMVRLHPENKTMSDMYYPECAIQGVAVHVIKALH